VILLALLTNIFERKQEARQPFVRLVEVTEDTADPKVWAQNWPFEYDSYLKTSSPTTTKYGGRGLGASDSGPAQQKLEREPWLKRIFAGYAFALDYRDRRGHFYGLFDQEQTKRVTDATPCPKGRWRAAAATTNVIDAIVAAKKAGASDGDLELTRSLHRRAQWRLDFVAAENSMGFHARARPHPRRDHRLCPAGPARGRAHGAEAMNQEQPAYRRQVT
jgi:formate-dependent nitrite reductase cytochrome c552 subunit